MNRIIIGEDLKDKKESFRETCFGLVIQDNKFLCVKDKDEVSLIGGGIENNESYEECLKREFLEEAGREIKKIEELCIIDCYWKTKNGIYMNSLSNIFIVQLTDEILTQKDDKELVLIEFENIINLLPLPYQKEAINQYFIKKGFNIEKSIINKEINIMEISPLTHKEKVFIYCHGLGSNKEQSIRFYKKLYKNSVSIISFDLPAHGQDKNDFKEFTLTKSIDYLNAVVKYAKTKYKEVYLLGSSYGGYVILNYLINNKNHKKTILMCPAINFCEIINEKMKINKDYFKTNNYIHLYGNVKIYKNAYNEFMEADDFVKGFNYTNIVIIQGKLDKTVSYEKQKAFVQNSGLKLITLENGSHELYDFNKEIVDILLAEIQ